MSWRATAYVKTLTTMPTSGVKLRPAQKLLLMVLADYYNDEEHAAWPSLGRLAGESLVTRRSAITIIQQCVAGGILTTESRRDTRGGYTSNLYRFVELVPSEEDSPGGGVMASPASENSSPPSEAIASPKRILNLRNELLEKERECDSELLQLWAMARSSCGHDELAHDLDKLQPVSLEDGVLTLRAPLRHIGRRCRQRIGIVHDRLAEAIPVVLNEVRIVSGD